jgi:penicillin-binding protein 2
MENRRYIVQGIFVFIGLIFLIKLFALQVADQSYYFKAERNIIHPIIEYPFRGLIYDRNGKTIVYNDPIYDLMVVPRDAYIPDTTAFCELLGITLTEFEENILAAKKYSSVKPSTFLKKISQEEYAKIQDKLYNYNGFFVNARTIRKYATPILANELGYIAEVDKNELARDTAQYYRSGDFKGKTGLERFYENEMRGHRGVSYKMVNVRGIDKGSFKGGEYDTISVPGKNIITTINSELQTYAERLFVGKRGSVVAIEPATGEILVMLSSPSYNPNSLSGRDFGDNFEIIAKDTNNLLFNRAIMAQYPPGSIFKTVQALVALDKNVIKADEQFFAQVVDSRMGDHAPSGYYDMTKGLEFSSNTYFLEVMRRVVNQGKDPNFFVDSEIGFAEWTEAVKKFGFGSPLGLDLPGEKGGNVPDTAYYNKIYGRHSWAYSGIRSLAIGQGEVLVTPLQVANLAAIIANRGTYIRPHLVKAIEENGVTKNLNFEKISTGSHDEYYDAIYEGMAKAVKRTAPRAVINDIEILGKTGTAENGVKDESLDHSVFMAFAPRENPTIAIAVYVENSGMGGRAAGMTASLIIEKYLRGYIKKNWYNREEYVLKGDFIDATNN